MVVSMKRDRTFQVSEVARITDVSVRTLHYYEEIGLLVPASRTDAGYRVYDHGSLLRLQQILIQRELGLSLEEIRLSLDDPTFDYRAVLLKQREQLRERAQATNEMIRAVDNALASLDEDKDMDMKQIFDGFDPAKYEAEAKERWGNTDAYKESMKRTKGYTEADWLRLKVEQSAVYRDAAQAMKAGKRPDDDEVMDIAERHRLLIDRWFYPCSFQMQCGLADMYEADGRFAENIDKYGAGLTPFLSAAIRANARRNGH